MHGILHGILELTQYSTWKSFTYKIKWRALPEIPSLLFILCPKGSRLARNCKQTPMLLKKPLMKKTHQLTQQSRISHERWFCVLNVPLVILQLCVPYRNNQMVMLGATDMSVWKQFNGKCWPRWMVCSSVWGRAKSACSKQRPRWRKSLKGHDVLKLLSPPHNYVKRGPKEREFFLWEGRKSEFGKSIPISQQ